MPSWGDHLLAALVAVAYPLGFTWDWHRRLRAQLETGGADARSRFYRRSMVELWLLTLAVVSWWLWSDRSVSEVGLGVPGGAAFWVGTVLVVALVGVLGRQVAVVRVSADARAKVQKQFRGAAALMVPRETGERRMWVGVSLTAGICEEVLYRGFLIWYSMMWLPAVAAVLASAVIFGLAHVYLGWGAGVLRAAGAGVVFGAAYLLTGTLWVPIALHVALDVASGLTASVAVDRAGPATIQSPGGEAG